MYRVYFNREYEDGFKHIKEVIDYLNPCFKLWVNHKSIGVIGNINGCEMPIFSYTGRGEEQYLKEYRFMLKLCQQYGIFNIEELKKGGKR